MDKGDGGDLMELSGLKETLANPDPQDRLERLGPMVLKDLEVLLVCQETLEHLEKMVHMVHPESEEHQERLATRDQWA